MPPEAQIIVFGLVSLLFFMISLFADDEDWLASVGCTGALVVYWALNTILWMVRVVEDWSLASDLLFAVSTLFLLLSIRRGWIAVLCGWFLANLALDGLHMAGFIDYASWAEAGNITFVGQLGTASFPGLVRITRSLTGRLTPTSMG
jgi:hypothetical protein